MTRIRWYRLIIALVVVDVIVVASGLWLHRQALSAFRDLLARSAALDARQRDVAALGHAVQRFGGAARRAAQEAEADPSIASIGADLGLLKSRTRLRGKRLDDFWKTTSRMTAACGRLVDLRRAGADRAQFDATLAEIDDLAFRAQRALFSEQESLLSQSAAAHLEHARLMERQDLIERVLAAAIVATFAALLWYARRLRVADRQLHEERKRVEHERRERLAAIGEVCTGVAHGIQNPLAAILSSTELMLDLGRLDADSRRRAEDVRTECARLSRRVRRLLTFARQPGGPRSMANAAETAREAVAEFTPLFVDKGITLRANITGEALPVAGHPEEIGSILLELLVNAAEYTPAGGWVSVSCRRDGDSVEIEVADNGPGVPPGTAEHMFDLFFTTRAGGSGVGLAWARRIAESLSGSLVHLAGAPGATFRLRLPLAGAAPRTATAARPARTPAPAPEPVGQPA